MTAKKNKNSGIVYSTESGRMCSGCGKPVAECICNRKAPAPKGSGTVRIHRETKGRKGQGVTVITGLPLTFDELSDLARSLKKKCGTGGTVKNGTIEIQGDRREMLLEELRQRGYSAKISGG